MAKFIEIEATFDRSFEKGILNTENIDCITIMDEYVCIQLKNPIGKQKQLLATGTLEELYKKLQ